MTQLNDEGRKVIEAAIVNYEDDARRCRLTASRDPLAITGNGETYAAVASRIDEKIKRLRENLP